MRIGSLFSGIGGLELGLERAIPGAQVVWQVEKDLYARRVLAKHWPEARRYEDVQEVGAHNLGVVDLICGGFPCQDISGAGKRAGLEGERSGLWFEFARIISEIQPRYVVLENVAALRSRGLDRVLGSLAESGYDAVWDCIPAAAVGAPHLRDRLFCVAWTTSSGVSDAIGNGLRDIWERNRKQYLKQGTPRAIDHGPNGAVAHSNSQQRRPGEEPKKPQRGLPRESSSDGSWWAI